MKLVLNKNYIVKKYPSIDEAFFLALTEMRSYW